MQVDLVYRILDFIILFYYYIQSSYTVYLTCFFQFVIYSLEQT